LSFWHSTVRLSAGSLPAAAWVVLPEVGDVFEVRRRRCQQPDHFHVRWAFGPPTTADDRIRADSIRSQLSSARIVGRTAVRALGLANSARANPATRRRRPGKRTGWFSAAERFLRRSEDYVGRGKTGPVRFLDAFVVFAGFALAVFCKAQCAATAVRPTIRRRLLKLYLYGYCIGFGRRGVGAECHRKWNDLAAGKLAPDFKPSPTSGRTTSSRCGE